MREMRNAYRIVVEILKGRDVFGDLSVHEMITFKWALKKYAAKKWTILIRHTVRTSVGSCEHINGPLHSAKSGELLE
jgi:hypothetical protein